MADASSVVYGSRIIDPSLFLGVLAWYEVRGVCVPHAVAVDVHTRLGLARALPAKPTDHNIFAKVCSRGGAQGLPTADPQVTANYLVRPVSSRLRHLVRETVNSSGEKLGYTTLAEVRFDATHGILAAPLAVVGAQGEDVLDALAADYGKWRGCLDSYAIREWIRNSFVDLQAVQVKAGMYFLRKEVQDVLDDIERFGLEVPGKVKLRTLPLVDDLKQRAMVREAFETEADQALDGLQAQLEADLDAGRELTRSAWEARRDEFANLMAKVDGLSELLEQQLLTSDARTKVVGRMINQLFKTVKTVKPVKETK